MLDVVGAKLYIRLKVDGATCCVLLQLRGVQAVREAFDVQQNEGAAAFDAYAQATK